MKFALTWWEGPGGSQVDYEAAQKRAFDCLLELADALEPELPPVSCAHREVRWLRGDRNRQAIRCAQIDHCVRGLQFPSRACSRCGGCCGGRIRIRIRIRIRSDRVVGFNGSVNEFPALSACRASTTFQTQQTRRIGPLPVLPNCRMRQVLSAADVALRESRFPDYIDDARSPSFS